MNAATLSFPKAPKLPHDWIALLTFESRQTAAQKSRVNATLARRFNVDTDGLTNADEL